MNWGQFGCRFRPFRPVAAIETYYAAAASEVALESLRQAVAEEEGVMLLVGPDGSGKTLIGRRLIEVLPQSVRTAHVAQARLGTRSELLQAILFDLGLPFASRAEQDLRLALMDSCLAHFASGGRTLVIVDDAQGLPADLLEELSLLTNLEGNGGRAIQVLLIGSSRLARRLDEPPLEQLGKRVGIRATLEPMPPDEAADYVRHHLRVTGADANAVFPVRVLGRMVEAVGGLPRDLNRAALELLRVAFDCELKSVPADVLDEWLEIRDGGQEIDEEDPEPDDKTASVRPAASVLPIRPEMGTNSHKTTRPVPDLSAIPFPPSTAEPSREEIVIFDPALPNDNDALSQPWERRPRWHRPTG